MVLTTSRVPRSPMDISKSWAMIRVVICKVTIESIRSVLLGVIVLERLKTRLLVPLGLLLVGILENEGSVYRPKV
jgi:hypothetical protein